MEDLIKAKIREFFQLKKNTAPEEDNIVVGPPKNEIFGDITFTAFKAAKALGVPAPQLTAELANYLQHEINLAQHTQEQGGFLNITLKDSYWIDEFHKIYAQPAFGIQPPTGTRIMVEYCAPNTNKPLHLGHLRNIFLGYAVGEILKAAGNEVVKVNMINDRGIHICKSMLAYQRFGNHSTPATAGMKGDHFVGHYYVLFETEYRREVAALEQQGIEKDKAEKEAPMMLAVQEMLRQWEAGDAAVRNLWKTMNQWVYEGFAATFALIGNDFQKVYYESESYLLGKQIVEAGLEKNVFYRKEDQSVWIDLRPDGLDEKLVLRKDGTSVYITQDIGTARMKYADFHCDISIYTVADEQNYHFKVLKLICQKLGEPYADGIFHLNYGMVDLPSGKMKSREGTVVDADDLIQNMQEEAARISEEQSKLDDFTAEEKKKLFHLLGMGALKFYILKVDPRKRMVFNPQESIDFHGHTGPFIQYTYARIQSVIRKHDQLFPGNGSSSSLQSLDPLEKALIRKIALYPQVIREAARTYEPSVVANYVFELAKLFNHFYAEIPILKCEEADRRQLRIQLCSKTGAILRHGLSLLGIDSPERM